MFAEERQSLQPASNIAHWLSLRSVSVSGLVSPLVLHWDSSVSTNTVTHDGSLGGWVTLSVSVVHGPSVGNTVSLSVSESVFATVSVGPSLGVASTDSVSVFVVG